METIEELGLRAGAAARADAAAVADPDDGWRRIRDDVGTVVPAPAAASTTSKRPAARVWALVAAAATVVGVGIAAVMVAGRDDSPHLGPDPAHTTVATVPEPSSTAPATSTSTSTTSTSVPVASDPIGVSYLDPPPELVLQPFARLPIAEAGADGLRQYFVVEDGVLVRIGNSTYRFVAWDGVWAAPVELDVPLAPIGAGPGDVVYGIGGNPITDPRIAAVAFGGELAGQELASTPMPPTVAPGGAFPWGSWGHGPTGLTQRGDGFAGREVAPYVDERGATPASPIDAPDVFLTQTPDEEVVQSSDGSRRWRLDIDAHPEAPTYAVEGFPQPTPTLDGGATVWRQIGQLVGAADFGESELGVVATLRPDGTGSWSTVPEGWQIVAGDLWGTVLVTVENGELLLARIEDGAAVDGNLCTRGAQAIVETLVERRLAGEGGADCLDAAALAGADAPPCWTACADGRLTSADAGEIGELFNAVTNETTWSVPVAVTFTNDFGFRTQRLERWALRRTGDDETVVTAIEVTTGPDDAAASETLVREYLDHLAAGRYDEAAVLLGASTAPFADRPDLQQLGPTAETDVAAALRAWCEAPSVGGERTLCTAPEALSTDITADAIDVTAWYVLDGRTVTATFRAGTSEGIPFVLGVPPRERPYPAEDVATLAAAYRASRLVAATPSGFWLVVDGTAQFVDTGSAGSPWIDAEFVYWTQWDAGGGQRSIAFLLDGTQVCVVDGAISRVRERAEGGYVATVERPTGEPVGSDETPIPAVAVDCATGSEQPIAPISWAAEGRSRGIFNVGGRTFTAAGDAEGNAVISNETDVQVTGPDGAITADFTADGSTVVYGEGGAGNPGVHDTNRLVARDTTSGAVAWSVALPRRFTEFWIVGDHIVVAHEPTFGAPTGMVHDEYTVVALATGDILGTIPANFQFQDMS